MESNTQGVTIFLFQESGGMQKIYEATTTTTTKVLKLQKCFCLLASASTNVNYIILSSNKIHNVSR